MEGIRDEQGNGTVDLGTVVASNEALKGRHEMRHDVL
jgi:hypothetical protein